MDIQTISVAIAGIGILIAAINSVLSSRDTKRQRQMELLMQLYDRYSTKEFTRGWIDIVTREWADYEEYEQKYGWLTNPDAASTRLSVGRFFEGLGVLVQEGYVDINLVNSLLNTHIVGYWERYGPIWKKRREQWGDFTMSDHTEFLYNELKKRQPVVATDRGRLL
jgi:hypothetical protein